MQQIRLSLSLLSFLVFHSLFSQHSPIGIKAVIQNEVPQEFLKLRLTNDSISANDLLNEEIVDLVEVLERDTLMKAKWTTHQSVLFNWFIRAIGYWWEPVDGMRYKFVGTTKDLLRLQNNEDDFLTEHDVIFNLFPHTYKYQAMMMRGYREQLTKRKAKDKDPSKPPYIWPTDSTAKEYRLHCELTPPFLLRDSLSALFFPCLPGPNLDTHHNFCDAKPTMGMYGPFVLDCNHSCHPEIHPYEWLWWLDLAEETVPEYPNEKVWLMGFMRESSNRFNKWSHLPRVGTISIPFILDAKTKNELKIEHLVTGEFLPQGIKKMFGLALLKDGNLQNNKAKNREVQNATKENALFDFDEQIVEIEIEDGRKFLLRISSDKNITSPALQWWLSDVGTDKKSNWIWGRFNVLVSIKDVWTARLRVRN